ncbi:MAG: right-handed parallel beta-helix repeat-containing protein [Phycisphaerae bacterium]|nr:right-handed parallel beta-helix repeat-containing protein [Phycisphaerae bacterium]
MTSKNVRLVRLGVSALLALACVGAPVATAMAQEGVTRPVRPASTTPEPTARKAWYVRTSGNDSNRGDTPVAAFRTVQKAIDAVNDAGGDHAIYVGPGTYSQGLQISSSRGTRSGYTGRPNVIFGDRAGRFTTDAPGDVIINPGTSATPLQVVSRSDWSFRNLIFRGGSNYNLFLSGSSRITFERCVIRPPAWYGVYAVDCPSFSLIENDFERTLDTGHNTYIYNSTGGDITVRGNFMALTGSAYRRSGMASGTFDWRRFSSGASGYPYGIIAMAYGSGTISSTITITNNIVSDCYLPVYAYTYSSSSGARFRIEINSNTVAASMYSLYVYDNNASPANIVNNVAADSYYGSYIYAPRGSVSGLMQQASGGSWALTVRAQSGFVTDKVPTFVDAAGMDFGPAVGSPAIDAGPATGAYGSDFFARARPYDPSGSGTALPDLGAVETQAGRAGVKILRWRERSMENDE